MLRVDAESKATKSLIGNLPNNSPARRPGAAGLLRLTVLPAVIGVSGCAKRTTTALPHAVTEPSPRHRHRREDGGASKRRR